MEAPLAASEDLAIEPEQNNFRMCKRNTTYLDRIHIIRACIGGCARPVKLKLGLVESNFQMEEIESMLKNAQTLEAITISMLLKTHNIKGPIDLLKCDIESAEAEIFSNCPGWIQKVNNLLIELHGPYTIQELMKDIQRNGGEFSYKLLPYSSGTIYFLKKRINEDRLMGRKLTIFLLQGHAIFSKSLNEARSILAGPIPRLLGR